MKIQSATTVLTISREISRFPHVIKKITKISKTVSNWIPLESRNSDFFCSVPRRDRNTPFTRKGVIANPKISRSRYFRKFFGFRCETKRRESKFQKKASNYRDWTRATSTRKNVYREKNRCKTNTVKTVRSSERAPNLKTSLEAIRCSYTRHALGIRTKFDFFFEKTVLDACDKKIRSAPVARRLQPTCILP